MNKYRGKAHTSMPMAGDPNSFRADDAYCDVIWGQFWLGGRYDNPMP